MDETRSLLEKEIKAQLEFMSNLDQKDEAYDKAVKNLEVLYGLKVKEDGEKKETPSNLERYIGYAIQVFGIVMPLCFYSAWMKRGLEFETTGTFTSQTFRGLFSKFKPTGLK